MYLIKVRNKDGTVILVAAVGDKTDAENRVAALKASGKDAYYIKE